MPQLTLPAPFGYKVGYHISLRTTASFKPADVERILVAYKCPAPIAKKAISCLGHSGRYDCVVAPYWFNHDETEVARKLAPAGVELVLLGRPDYGYPGLAAQQQRQGQRFDKVKPSRSRLHNLLRSLYG